MKGIILGMCALLITGCTSSRTWVASPMESKINGETYHYHNLVVLKDKPSMFHVTESRSWMEYCKKKIENPITQDQQDYPYQDCVRESQYLANGAPSIAQQAVTPVVTTAIGASGFVLGMHALGKGIAHSGSRTTNNNNNSAEGGEGGDGGAGGSANSKSSNMQNSGNKTTNHSVNNSRTNINSNNHLNNGKH